MNNNKKIKNNTIWSASLDHAILRLIMTCTECLMHMYNITLSEDTINICFIQNKVLEVTLNDFDLNEAIDFYDSIKLTPLYNCYIPYNITISNKYIYTLIRQSFNLLYCGN